MKNVIKRIILCSTFLMLILGTSVHAAGVGITLDGYYDDWSDKPGVQLKYDWYNPGQVHTVKWHTDDKYLYLNIKMGTVGGQQLNYYIIYFQVNNGPQKQLQFAPDSPNNGRISVFDVNGGYTKVSDDGYVTRGSNSDGKTSDQGEFKIPLTVFEKSSNQMMDLKLQFPNLGKQTLEFQVGSTHPYIGIAICGGVVLFSFAIYTIRKRKKA